MTNKSMTKRTRTMLGALVVGFVGAASAGAAAQEEWSDHRPVISPDGSSLAFMSDRAGTWSVWVLSLVGEGPAWRVSEDPAGEWYPDWSPDGTTLVYHRQVGEADTTRLLLYDVERRVERPVGPSDGEHRYARWTPDGATLLHVCETGVCAMDVATGEVTRVPELDGEKHDPAPSPDGEWIAFVEAVAGASDEAFFMRWDGSERTRITEDSGRTYGLDWSPDGRFLAYNTASEGGEGDVWIYDVRSGQRRRLTEDPANDHLPRWAPDGTSLVFSSEREGAERIFRVDLASGRVQPVSTRARLP